MSWTPDLLTGIAETLAAAGAGTWRPDGSAYTTAETAIAFYAHAPGPDKQIILSVYDQPDQDGIGDVTVALQVRVRGDKDPRTADGLDDACIQALDGLSHTTFGSVRVYQINRQSGALLGRDENDRWERSSNFYIQARRQTALRTD